MKYNYTTEQLEIAVKECLSIAEVCRFLNIVPAGGNYGTINRNIKKNNFDISHFTGAAWNQGKRFRNFGKRAELKDILVENSNYSNTSSIREKLIREGIKEHKCEGCNNTEWRNKLIPLELEHKNGINNDHRLENLELLCPNCHAQTPFYRGKNIKKVRDKIKAQ